MDEKTEELRDLFLDVTDEEAVTERQADPRGSIAVDEGEIEDRLRSTIGTMAERYEMETTLSRDELVGVVRLFYRGDDDEAIADDLGEDVSAEEVRRARIELHLVTDEDRDGPIDVDDLREFLDTGRSIEEIAEEFDASETTVERSRRVAEIEEERRLVGDRFREEFEHALGDRALAERLTERVTEDGLEDATEGIETDVSF